MVEEGNNGRSTLTVNTTNQLVSRLQPYARRILVSITNTSTGGQVIYLAFGQEAVVGQGIPLYPGGYYAESSDTNFAVTNDDINAIASAAGGTIAVLQRNGRRVQ